MTPEIAICLAIVAAAVVLFAWERIAADVVALGVMLACAITGLLAPREAFAGFSSDTVIMILGLLIMTAGLANTGVVDIAGRAILGYAGGRSGYLLLPDHPHFGGRPFIVHQQYRSHRILPSGSPGLCQEARYQRIEIPLAAGLRLDRVELGHPHQHLDQHRGERAHDPKGLPAMGMFEMAPVGIPIAVAGVIYMWALGTRLIPERETSSRQSISATASTRRTSSCCRTRR